MRANAAEASPRPSTPDTGDAPTRVLIADDAPAVRYLLRRTLEASGRFEVVGEAGDGLRAIDLARELQPALVVLDIAMPAMSGLDAIPEITACSPGSTIVVLSGCASDEMAKEAIRLGAHAYIEKGRSPSDLVQSILKALDEDVTIGRQLRVLTADLERANAELARSNDDLTDFAAVAAHDLKSPLQVIAGFAELLQRVDGQHLGDTGRDSVTAILTAAKRMDTLIDDVLAYSRIDSAPRVEDAVPLGAAVDRALAALRSQVERLGATFEIGALPTVTADQSQIDRLFQNLLSNALKFASDDVALHGRVFARRIDDGWTVTVEDNGIGIDAADRATVFRMFERMHPRGQYDGHGIGLAICRHIVERRGGRVWADANPEGGTRISFTLPDTQPSAPTPGSAAPAAAAQDLLTILIVEADADEAGRIGRVVAQALPGCRVHRAGSGEVAAGFLADHRADCALVDLAGPERGLGALHRILAVRPTMPIVALTAGADQSLALAALREGAQDHLTVDRFDAERLARAVRYAIKRKTLDRELAADALHDPLTGLANRSLLVDRVQLALARAERLTTTVAILVLGIDGLQAMNERFGYQTVDRVLVLLGERLVRTVRPQDTVARIHGDHFVVVCEGFGATDHVNRVLSRLIEAVRRPIELDVGTVALDASAGVALSEPGSGAIELLQHADDALSRTKARR